MDTVIYIISMSALMIGLFLIMNNHVKKVMEQLAEKLYVQHDASAFLTILNKPLNKLVFNKSTRALLSIEAYVLQHDYTEVINVFTRLENMRLTSMNKVGLYQKELTFYIDTKSPAKAKTAYENLRALCEPNKNKQIQSLLKEAEYLYEIHMNHNVDYLDVMLQEIDKSENAMYQGICEFRIAKIYYYKQEIETCREYLHRALVNLRGTQWETLINQILDKDINLID